MWRVLLAVAWLTKGILLTIVLAAAVAWPVSCWRQGAVRLSRYTVEPRQVLYLGYDLACWNGRVGIGRLSSKHMRKSLWSARAEAAAHGLGWRWKLLDECDSWI